MASLKKEIIIPAGGAKPVAPYSPGVRLDQMVFTSGQIGLDPATGKLMEGGVAAQARQALENLKDVLETAGADFSTVLKTTVFLTDMKNFGEVNAVYAEFFPQDPPARSAIQVAALPIGALVEVEAIAFVPEG